jgi:hypothetical protein
MITDRRPPLEFVPPIQGTPAAEALAGKETFGSIHVVKYPHVTAIAVFVHSEQDD